MLDVMVMPLIVPGRMTTKEAAEYLGIKPSRVRQLVIAGILSSEKIGQVHLIPFEEVQQYKAERKKAGWQQGKPRKP